MTGVIVLGSLLFALVYFIAWLLRPGLRDSIERPKFRFLASVQNADRASYHRVESDEGR